MRNMVREYTNKLIELGETDMVSWERIARAALEYMSEDEVKDLYKCEFDDEDETEMGSDEDEEETEIEIRNYLICSNKEEGFDNYSIIEDILSYDNAANIIAEKTKRDVSEICLSTQINSNYFGFIIPLFGEDRELEHLFYFTTNEDDLEKVKEDFKTGLIIDSIRK